MVHFFTGFLKHFEILVITILHLKYTNGGPATCLLIDLSSRFPIIISHYCEAFLANSSLSTRIKSCRDVDRVVGARGANLPSVIRRWVLFINFIWISTYAAEDCTRSYNLLYYIYIGSFNVDIIERRLSTAGRGLGVDLYTSDT